MSTAAMRRVDFRWDIREDWGRGAWIATLYQPTRAVDFVETRDKQKLPDRALAGIGESIAGWEPTLRDVEELAELGAILKTYPDAVLTLKGDGSCGWVCTITGVAGGHNSRVEHAKPHEAVIRALDEALSTATLF